MTNIRNIEAPECFENTTTKDKRHSTLFQCPTTDANIWTHPNVSWILVTFNEKLSSCETSSCPAKVEFIELYEVSNDECSKPDVPAFGKLVPIRANGAVARFRYACEDFFTMHEKKVVEIACNRYDDWFPKSLPKCEPNITCDVEYVDELKISYNWLWSETEAVVGTIATFECVDNTTKINGTAKRECRSDGMWNEEMPQCIPIQGSSTETPIRPTYNPYPNVQPIPQNPVIPVQYPTQSPYPNQNPYPNVNPNPYPVTQRPNPYPNQNPNPYPQTQNPYPNQNPYPTQNPNPYPNQNPNPYPNQNPNPYPNQNPNPFPNQSPYPTANPHPYPNQNPNPNPNPSFYPTTVAPIQQYPNINQAGAAAATGGSLTTIHFVYIVLGVLLGILLTIGVIYYIQKRRRESMSSHSERQMDGRNNRSGRTVRDEVFYDHINSINNTLNETRISNTCLADQTVDSNGGLFPYDSAGYVQIEAHESMRMNSFKKYENYDRNNNSPKQQNKPLPQVPK